MYDSEKASAAQEALCNENGWPNFTPNRYVNYQCFRCKQNIFAEKGHPAAEHLPRGRVRLDYNIDKHGISVEKASSTLITGCPFCCASYCD